MSSLRDIRLITARHLALPSHQREAIISFLNVFDAVLDEQGFSEEDIPEIRAALAKVERAMCNDDELEEMEEDLLNEQELIPMDAIDRSDDEDDTEY